MSRSTYPFGPRRSFAGLLVLLPLLLSAFFGACGDPAEEAAKGPTIDVEEPIVVPEVDDQVEVRHDRGLSGVLPADFPDLPLFLPASLVDLGRAEGGRAWAEFLTTAGASEVERTLLAAVGDAGWTVVAAEGGHTLTRGAQRVRLTIAARDVGTAYRVTY